MLSFIFGIVCSLFEWPRICTGLFMVCVYSYCSWRWLYQEGRVFLCCL